MRYVLLWKYIINVYLPLFDICVILYSVMGYTLLLGLIEYKTLVMRGDFERANEILPSIPKEHHNRYVYVLKYFSSILKDYCWSCFQHFCNCSKLGWRCRIHFFSFPFLFLHSYFIWIFCSSLVILCWIFMPLLVGILFSSMVISVISPCVEKLRIPNLICLHK